MKDTYGEIDLLDFCSRRVFLYIKDLVWVLRGRRQWSRCMYSTLRKVMKDILTIKIQIYTYLKCDWVPTSWSPFVMRKKVLEASCAVSREYSGASSWFVTRACYCNERRDPLRWYSEYHWTAAGDQARQCVELTSDESTNFGFAIIWRPQRENPCIAHATATFIIIIFCIYIPLCASKTKTRWGKIVSRWG